MTSRGQALIVLTGVAFAALVIGIREWWFVVSHPSRRRRSTPVPTPLAPPSPHRGRNVYDPPEAPAEPRRIIRQVPDFTTLAQRMADSHREHLDRLIRENLERYGR